MNKKILALAFSLLAIQALPADPAVTSESPANISHPPALYDLQTVKNIADIATIIALVPQLFTAITTGERCNIHLAGRANEAASMAFAALEQESPLFRLNRVLTKINAALPDYAKLREQEESGRLTHKKTPWSERKIARLTMETIAALLAEALRWKGDNLIASEMPGEEHRITRRAWLVSTHTLIDSIVQAVNKGLQQNWNLDGREYPPFELLIVKNLLRNTAEAIVGEIIRQHAGNKTLLEEVNAVKQELGEAGSSEAAQTPN